MDFEITDFIEDFNRTKIECKFRILEPLIELE